MYSLTPDPNNEAHKYQFDPINATDNKGLDMIAEKLELIYTTLDWPLVTPSLEVSLYQSGKSRADLWQFAGMVALELALERANRACDLDYHARQQVILTHLLVKDNFITIFRIIRLHCLKVEKLVKSS